MSTQQITRCDDCRHNPKPAAFRVATDYASGEGHEADVCLHHYGARATRAQSDPSVVRFVAERIAKREAA